MERNIKYLNKDFSSFKEQLVEFAKNYFPDTYTDFSESSPGMMFIEMAAYVGEVLGFYQDNQVQETFLQYVKNPSNLYHIAYMMGYRPKVTTVAEVELTVSDTVDAIEVSGTYQPNWSQAYRIGEYSEIRSNTVGNISFLTKEPVDFNQSSSSDPTFVEIGSVEDEHPAEFILTKKVKAFSGQIKKIERTVGEYQKYRTLTISDKNIVGILDIVDSDGNTWYEVPFLGQDTIFEDVSNKCSIGNIEPHTLSLKKVSRRFVTRFNSKGELNIQFGAGMYASDEDEKNFLPNPISLASDIQELSSEQYDLAYDPSNFLFTKSYGLAPVNTKLTIRYIVGGGTKSNVPANTITVGSSNIFISSKDGSEVETGRITYNNLKAASGGRDGDTVEEIRQNCLRSFAEQKRLVTLNDFNVRALSMPSKYGSIAKVYAANESLIDIDRSVLEKNPLAITLYVLSYNLNGNLTYASDAVKNNLATYLSQYLMVTDAIDIKNAFIVNLGIKYDIVLRPNYSSNDVLLRCNKALQDYFSIDDWSINEPIKLSEVYALLDTIEGVQTVKNITLENKVGVEKGYSEYAYDIDAATKDSVVYPSYDPCIFEIRYPNIDIEGRIVAL